MKFSTLSCSLLACFSPLVSATALTYKLSANEKACFFSFVETKGAKVAFYFAVSIPTPKRLPREFGIGLGHGSELEFAGSDLGRDWDNLTLC